MLSVVFSTLLLSAGAETSEALRFSSYCAATRESKGRRKRNGGGRRKKKQQGNVLRKPKCEKRQSSSTAVRYFPPTSKPFAVFRNSGITLPAAFCIMCLQETPGGRGTAARRRSQATAQAATARATSSEKMVGSPAGVLRVGEAPREVEFASTAPLLQCLLAAFRRQKFRWFYRRVCEDAQIDRKLDMTQVQDLSMQLNTDELVPFCRRIHECLQLEVSQPPSGSSVSCFVITFGASRRDSSHSGSGFRVFATLLILLR